MFSVALKIIGFCVLMLGLLLLASGAMMFFTSGSASPGDRSGAWALLGVGFLFSLIGSRWMKGRKPDSWKNDPATERQREFADDLGIRYSKNITKGELSDLISKATGK